MRILNDSDEDDKDAYSRATLLALNEFDAPSKNRKQLGIHDLFLDKESRDTVALLCRYPGLYRSPRFPAAALLASAFLGPCGDVSVLSHCFIQRVGLDY